MQRTSILQLSDTIRATDLSCEEGLFASAGNSNESGLQQDLCDREYRLILDALKTSNGRRAATAEALNISPRTLRYKLARMREHGIEIPGDHHE